MANDICACKDCNCKIGEHSIVRHGKHYCCQACADHHPNGEACASSACKCAKGAHG